MPSSGAGSAAQRGGGIDARAAVASDRIGEGVSVGPFAVIGPHVELERDCRVAAHAVIEGRTRVGARTTIGPHAVVGAPPQVRGLRAEDAGELVIGADNQLRELTTVHAGSAGSRTELGDANMLMAYAHVAHDCIIGNGVELANCVQLAGHVRIGDHAVLGGLAAVHQFTRVGEHAFVAGAAMAAQDVPPFCQVAGDRARLYGLNVVGLRRHGFSADERRALSQALRLLYGADLLSRGIEAAAADASISQYASVQRLLDFARSSKRGLCRAVIAKAARRGAGSAT
ncbi:MAG: acyl-ACP--UDP-N-acetylglucosamine O-acyltransferase [Myxococcales bacterium]|nr:acyl-ACP--UDP-N-acetylglucosamine O-acyltransferase [Myxococcales bacterium]